MSEQYIDGQIEAPRDVGCEKVLVRPRCRPHPSPRARNSAGSSSSSGRETWLSSRRSTAWLANLRFLLEILDTLKEGGVGIKSLREPPIDTTTASGELAPRIFGVIAEFERRRIRERIHAGLDHARGPEWHVARPAEGPR